MRRPNFSAFRNHTAITNALFWYCDAYHTAKGMRAKCPQPKCQDTGKHTLVCAGVSPVAYCHRCQKTYDALSIVVIAERVSLWEACDKLEHFSTEY